MAMVSLLHDFHAFATEVSITAWFQMIFAQRDAVLGRRKFWQQNFDLSFLLVTMLWLCSFARMELCKYAATHALAGLLLHPYEPSGRLWHCGSAAVGDEEACFAMPPAPVGTGSSGEPLPLHAGTVALLQQPDFWRTAFSNFSVGTNVRKCSSARLRPQLGCRRNVLDTTSDRSLAWTVIFDIIAQGLLGPGPRPGDHQTLRDSISISRLLMIGVRVPGDATSPGEPRPTFLTIAKDGGASSGWRHSSGSSKGCCLHFSQIYHTRGWLSQGPMPKFLAACRSSALWTCRSLLTAVNNTRRRNWGPRCLQEVVPTELFCYAEWAHMVPEHALARRRGSNRGVLCLQGSGGRSSSV